MKAKYSEPCIRCGYCCEKSLCPAAEIVFPRGKAPCPMLLDGAEKSCGLVVAEGESGLERMVAKSLGIGCGCSCPDDDTTEDEIMKHEFTSCMKMYGEAI